MYEDFLAQDRWSKLPIRCLYQALIVAIATRHADAVDVALIRPDIGDEPRAPAAPLSDVTKVDTLDLVRISGGRSGQRRGWAA